MSAKKNQASASLQMAVGDLPRCCSSSLAIRWQHLDVQNVLLEHLQRPLTPAVPKVSPEVCEFRLASHIHTKEYCAQVPDEAPERRAVTAWCCK